MHAFNFIHEIKFKINFRNISSLNICKDAHQTGKIIEWGKYRTYEKEEIKQQKINQKSNAFIIDLEYYFTKKSKEAILMNLKEITSTV